VLLNHALPRPPSVNKILDDLEDFILRCADLFCRVTLSEGNRSILERLKVDGDAKWCSQFVVAGVPSSNRLAGIIDFV
jgi:hypothetical protein